MKTAVVVIGIILLLIGVGLTAYAFTSSGSSNQTSNSVVNPRTTRDIDAGGTWSPGASVLTKGEVVTGTFTISNYSSSSGPVYLYIQNQSEFIAWGGCAPCTSPSLENWTLPSSGTYTFTWTVPYSSSFYMSFDNEYYSADAPAVYLANSTITTTGSSSSPNTTYLDSGAALIVIGAIIIAVGVIMTGGKKSSTQRVAPAQQDVPPPSPVAAPGAH